MITYRFGVVNGVGIGDRFRFDGWLKGKGAELSEAERVYASNLSWLIIVFGS